MNLSKILFRIGAKYRNPSLWNHYSELKKTEKYSFEELKAYQDQYNKMAWIIDRLSIDEYHENNMPSDLVKQNVIEFLGRV